MESGPKRPSPGIRPPEFGPPNSSSGFQSATCKLSPQLGCTAAMQGRGTDLKLKIFHQQFIVIAAAALVAALSMALLFAINLRSGFNGYLAARDALELDRFVEVTEARLAREGGAAAWRQRRVTLRSLLQELAVIEGHPPGRIADGPPPPHAGGPPPGRRLFGMLGGRPPPPDEFGARLMLFDAQGTQLAGPPPPPRSFSAAGVTSRPIRLDGAQVGTVRMIPRPPVPIGVDAQFLTTQYEGAAVLLVVLLVLGALPAWGIARVVTGRIGAIHAATDAIARGDLAARILPRGKDELGDMAANINHMAESLARLDAARRRWLAEVSHELRSPLAALRGGLDALEDGVRPLSPGAIASLSEDAHRLSRLVDDLHMLAMADLAALPCQFAPLEPGAFCRAMVTRLNLQAPDPGLTFRLTLGDLPASPVWWDARRIEQLLTNLGSNSLRYTDPPGRIELNCAADAAQVVLRMDDTAPGIPPDQIDQIFEPLYRLDEARSRATGGSGLGLAVCQAIVRAHGGTMTATASPLGGLRITVTLPLDARQP